MFPDDRALVLIQHHLPDLTARKIHQKLRRVGAEQDLVFARQAVKNPAGRLLQLRVQKQLRVFHDDDAGRLMLSLDVRLQKRQHVNALHAAAHGHTGGRLPVPGGPQADGKHLLRIRADLIGQLVVAPVFVEIFVDALYPVSDPRLQKLVFQKLPRLGRIQIGGPLLIDEADALEAVRAFLTRIENAAGGAGLAHGRIVIKQQQIPLETLQAPGAVDVVNPRQNLRDIRIVLSYPVRIADRSTVIGEIRKRQLIAPAGRKAAVKFPLPDLKALIAADPPHPA